MAIELQIIKTGDVFKHIYSQEMLSNNLIFVIKGDNFKLTDGSNRELLTFAYNEIAVTDQEDKQHLFASSLALAQKLKEIGYEFTT